MQVEGLNYLYFIFFKSLFIFCCFNQTICLKEFSEFSDRDVCHKDKKNTKFKITNVEEKIRFFLIIYFKFTTVRNKLIAVPLVHFFKF